MNVGKKLKTNVIYRFLRVESDTVPEFHFSWFTLPQVTSETYMDNIPVT